MRMLPLICCCLAACAGAAYAPEAGEAVVGLSSEEPPSSGEAKLAAVDAQEKLKATEASYDTLRENVDKQNTALEENKVEQRNADSAQLSAKGKLQNLETLAKEAKAASKAAHDVLHRSEAKLKNLNDKATAADGDVSKAMERHAETKGKFEAAKLLQGKLPKNSAHTFDYTSTKLANDHAVHAVETAKYAREQFRQDIVQLTKKVEGQKEAAKAAQQILLNKQQAVQAAGGEYKQVTAKVESLSEEAGPAALTAAAEEKKLEEMEQKKKKETHEIQAAEEKAYEAEAAAETKKLVSAAEEKTKATKAAVVETEAAKKAHKLETDKDNSDVDKSITEASSEEEEEASAKAKQMEQEIADQKKTQSEDQKKYKSSAEADEKVAPAQARKATTTVTKTTAVTTTHHHKGDT